MDDDADKPLHHQLHSKGFVGKKSYSSSSIESSNKFINTCKNCSYIFRILTTEVAEFCSKGNKLCKYVCVIIIIFYV